MPKEDLKDIKCKCTADAVVFLVDSQTGELIIALCDKCKDNIDLIMKRDLLENEKHTDNTNLH